MSDKTCQECGIEFHDDIPDSQPNICGACYQAPQARDEIKDIVATLNNLEKQKQDDAKTIATLRDGLQFIAFQQCTRYTAHATIPDCIAAGDCITEYCTTCYARCVLTEMPPNERMILAEAVCTAVADSLPAKLSVNLTERTAVLEAILAWDAAYGGKRFTLA